MSAKRCLGGGCLKSLADFGDKEGFLADKKSKYGTSPLADSVKNLVAEGD